MRIKYRFDNIHSNADTIKVSSGPEDIIVLNKADFQDNWANALNKDYYVLAFSCNDLANLTITGAEAHPTKYTEETNTKWKAFTKNKIGSKHFDDPSVTSTLDKDKPLIIYNQEDLTTQSALTRFLTSINTKFKDYKYDLSQLNFSYSNSLPQYICPSYYSSGILHTYPLYANVSKWFHLPEGMTELAYAFYECSSLEETPAIPDTVTGLYYTFYSSGIIKVNELPDSITNMQGTFTNCTKLQSFDTELPSNVINLSSTFSGCTALTSFTSEIPSTVTNCTNMFYNTALESFTQDLPETIVNKTSMFGNCKKLKELGNISGNLAQVTYHSNGCAPIEKVGNLYINNSASRAIPSSVLKTVGNITFDLSTCNIDNTHFIVPTSETSIGIVNLIQKPSYYLTARYMFPSAPGLCIAIPYYYHSLLWPSFSVFNGTNPTSTGYNLWVDYYPETSDVFHNITLPTYEITEDVSTLNNSETIYVKNFNILKKNDTYKHTFEVTECSIATSVSTTGTNVNTSNIKFTVNADGTANIEIPCTNIQDDSVSSGTIVKNIYYTALIDGNEFHGATKVTVNFQYTWTLDEDVSVMAEIDTSDEDPVEDEVVEENTEESTDTPEEDAVTPVEDTSNQTGDEE